MSLILAGQVAGVAFACGLNLYITVAALGILSRLGGLPDLPLGLQGLEGGIVISSALVLYLIEAVIDKIPHMDSVWDTVHTFIRPPAAALLAVGALWGQPTRSLIVGAGLAFLVALTAHGAKGGLRMTLNASRQTKWQSWISVGEDALAVALAIAAFRFPIPTLATVAAALGLGGLVGPQLWRAFRLGGRAVSAWLRSIFEPARWLDYDELPRDVRDLIGTVPLGAAPPKGARATLHDPDGAGAFRNGWLVRSDHELAFIYRTLLGKRRIDLPAPREIDHEGGVWAHTLRIAADDGTAYTLFMLKDGPAVDVAIQQLSPTPV